MSGGAKLYNSVLCEQRFLPTRRRSQRVVLVDTRVKPTSVIRGTWHLPAPPPELESALEAAAVRTDSEPLGARGAVVMMDEASQANPKSWGNRLVGLFEIYFGRRAVTSVVAPQDDFVERFPSLCAPLAQARALKIENQPFPSLILWPGLFLGDARTAASWPVFMCLRISHVVDASNQDSLQEHFLQQGVAYCTVPLEDADSEPLKEHFDATFRFIDDALADPEARVLVHCRAGVSRSATLVIWYLARKMGIGIVDAYTVVKNCRDFICPNLGFRHQLYEAEVALRGESRSSREQLQQFGIELDPTKKRGLRRRGAEALRNAAGCTTS
eukprot:m.66637 g.66637  ORF g.66637 m.66637 type:complete len:328 (-) comp7630_c1_seq2:59-1042(-)